MLVNMSIRHSLDIYYTQCNVSDVSLTSQWWEYKMYMLATKTDEWE